MSFEAIYREHAPFVWRFVRRLGIHPADVEDVCQEVFVVVHRRYADYDPTTLLRTWIAGIAMRTASDHRRRAHRRHETVGDVPEGAAPPTQGEEIDQARARLFLDRALDELDDDKRAVFVLFELEQLPMAEVAETVGIPLQTAYSRLAVARKKIEEAARRVQLALASKAGVR